MADKEWDALTTTERCDRLKASMERIYEIANQLSWEMKQMQRQLEAKLNQIAAAVEKLESQKRE